MLKILHLPENTSPVFTVAAAVTKTTPSHQFWYVSRDELYAMYESHTCRELLDGHRWYSNTLRPVSNLRLGELCGRSAPLTLELLLPNCLLSCSLLLLLNLFRVEQNKSVNSQTAI